MNRLITLSSFLNRCLDYFLDLLHKGQIIHRIILFWALWQSTSVIQKTFNLVDQIAVLSANDALVIGALLGPILGLTGFIIKLYATGQTSDKINNISPSVPSVAAPSVAAPPKLPTD